MWRCVLAAAIAALLLGCGNVRARDVERGVALWGATPTGATLVCGKSTLGLSDVRVKLEGYEVREKGASPAGVGRAVVQGVGAHSRPCRAEIVFRFSATLREGGEAGYVVEPVEVSVAM